MNNRINFFYLLAAFVLVTATACEDEELLYSEEDVFHFRVDGLSICEGDSDTLMVPVYHTKMSEKSGSVTFVLSSDDADEGTDYLLLNESNTLTFGADEYIKNIMIQPIDDISSGDGKFITVSLVDGTDAVGFPGVTNRFNDTLTVEIGEDDSPIAVPGEYDVSATGSSTDGCCPDETTVSSTVTVTDLGDGLFQLSDFSGGLYLEWYDVYGITSTNQSPATFRKDCNDITIVDTVEPFGTAVNGTGKIDITNGVITYSWSNGYGDTGTVTLTPQ